MGFAIGARSHGRIRGPRRPWETCLNAHAALDSRVPGNGTLSARERDGPPRPVDEPQDKTPPIASSFAPADASDPTPAEELFATVKTLLASMDGPRTEAGVAEYLNVSRPQAGVWLKRFVEAKLRDLFKRMDELKTEAEVAEALQVTGPQVRGSLKRLVEEGTIEKLPRSRPVRYRCAGSIGPLFDQDD